MRSIYRHDLVLPNPVDYGQDWPDLQAAFEEFGRLTRQRREGFARLTALEAERDQVAEVDRDRHAEALRDGKPEPTPGVKKVDERLAAQRRLLDALERAIEIAGQRLSDVLEEHRAEYAAAVQAGIERERERLAQAVEGWAEARERVQRQRHLLGFVRGHPVERLQVGGTRPVAGIIGRNSDATPLALVLEALRAEARPAATNVRLSAGLPQPKPPEGAVYVSPGKMTDR